MGQTLYAPFHSTHGLKRVDSNKRVWNGIAVQYIEMHAEPGGVWGDISSDQTVFAVLLGQRGGIVEARHELNRPTPRSRFDEGFAVWVPANHKVWGFSETARLVREVRLTFDSIRAESILGDDFDANLATQPLLMLYDRRLAQCARLLADACIEQFSGDRIYGESITTAVFAALFRAWRGHSVRSSSSTELTPWRLKRSIDFLESNVASDVSLADLARESGLSQSQFARAFRASTGLPPYRYLLQARVQRAQRLLAKTSKPIVDIALDVGFADQSHFTKAFHRFAGATPLQWRRDRRCLTLESGGR